MMQNKLAFRNLKRSIRDYLVYFLTMALVTALMFSFNTLIFSEDVQRMFEMAGIMTVMIGLGTVFIIWIVAWLIHYMVRFMMEKRSREFGIYLLLGMKRNKIAGLYLRENLLFGAVAFAAGLVLGSLLQQILLSVFYSMVQQDYQLRLEWNRSCLLMTACCYAGCYLIALFRCRKRFKKMSIRDFMDFQKKNEEISEAHENVKRLYLPCTIALFIGLGLLLFCYKKWNAEIIILFLVGLVLTIYLFYIGLSAWISCYVKQKKKAVYKRDSLFLLRQFSSKIRTMSFTMGTLTALFTLALLGSAVAMMFHHYQNQILVEKFPFDVMVHSSRANDDFHREIELLKKETKAKEFYPYQIYENGTNQVNAWLYAHLRVFGQEYQNADGTPDMEKIRKIGDFTYGEYDTYMGLSDYNHLRQMLDLPMVTLKENEYDIHIKERVLKETGDFSKELMINGCNGPLTFREYHTESFSQDGHNGGDYIIVVPDAVIAQMKPYYAQLAVDLEGAAPADLQRRLDELETEEEQDTLCAGSDTIVVYCAKNLVRDNLIPEIKYMLSAIIFPLIYVGLVFLCVALTVLSVQQLSDSVRYRFRYRVLSQIGCSRKDISRMVGKQLLGYYMCPVAVALMISGLITVYVGNRFNFYTGLVTSSAFYFLISTCLFLGIYLVYFIITYLGFQYNIEKK